MSFDVLPARSASAAANMATDFLLLQRYPHETHARFRHYGWHRPAFTFGFSQKLAFVRDQLPADEALELCRRPTGGGIVDHREDWTYALVIPRGHALYDQRATESYRAIHTDLTAALAELGCPALVKDRCEPPAEGTSCAVSGVCFNRAELYDVVHAVSGAKLAGAAQKRNKRGLLFQGSIDRAAVGPLDWDAFTDVFTTRLAATLVAEATPIGWPEFSDEELDGLTEQYASSEWLAYR